MVLTEDELVVAKYFKQLVQQYDMNIMIHMSRNNSFVLRNYKGSAIADYWLDWNWNTAYFNSMWDIYREISNDIYWETYDFYQSLIRNQSDTTKTKMALDFLLSDKVVSVLDAITVDRILESRRTLWTLQREVTIQEVQAVMEKLWDNIKEWNFYFVD